MPEQDSSVVPLHEMNQSLLHFCTCYCSGCVNGSARGLANVQERRHDPRRGMSLLVEDWVSRASALQRKGRAGRVRAGVCWGLYTRHRFEHRLRRYQVRPPCMWTPVSVCCHTQYTCTLVQVAGTTYQAAFCIGHMVLMCSSSSISSPPLACLHHLQGIPACLG